MQTTRHLESAATRTSAAVSAAALIGLLAFPVSAQSPTAIPAVVARGVEPRLVEEGFGFTEGPVGTPDGGLYFSDIRPNRIYRLDSNGGDRSFSRADQRRQRPRGDARGRFAGGGRRGQADQQTQPR